MLPGNLLIRGWPSGGSEGQSREPACWNAALLISKRGFVGYPLWEGSLCTPSGLQRMPQGLTSHRPRDSDVAGGLGRRARWEAGLTSWADNPDACLGHQRTQGQVAPSGPLSKLPRLRGVRTSPERSCTVTTIPQQTSGTERLLYRQNSEWF